MERTLSSRTAPNFVLSDAVSSWQPSKETKLCLQVAAPEQMVLAPASNYFARYASRHHRETGDEYLDSLVVILPRFAAHTSRDFGLPRPCLLLAPLNQKPLCLSLAPGNAREKFLLV